MHRVTRFPALFALLLLAVACEEGDREAPGAAATSNAGDESAETVAVHEAQTAFLSNLQALCGRAFRGEATGPSADSPDFAGEMIMHVRHCEEGEIQIPLHVGENRSRTWIVTRTDAGLRLKHDHRHEDGSEAAPNETQYGGDTAEAGTAMRQSFPADAYTAEQIPEASTNVWSMTIEPGERFVYHLTRHGEPRATFEFDLTDEVEPPPAPWGYEGS